MNRLEKFFDNIGWMRKEKGVIPSVSSSGATDPFSIWRSQKKIDPAKALEVYTGWVYAAIRAIGMEIGGMEHRLFQVGAENDKELFDHDLLDLLYGVNDYQTGLELKYVTAAHLEAVGNAYWYLEGVKGAMDKPLALHVMNPAKVKVIVNREEFPTRIQGYQYRLGTKTYNFQPYEILHFKYPDPNDQFEGIGTVQSIAQWVDADNYAMEFNRRFFLNGARVNSILESDSAYTPEQLEYLKTSFDSAFAGVQNAYKTLALPKGVSFKEGGQTQKDLDFSTLMEMMRDRIIAGFKVPRTVLGITDDVNRANAEATDYVFAARTIKPIMKFITSYLNEFLVPRYGDNLYLDFVDPVPEDRAVKIDEMNKSLGSQGATPTITINEARDKYFGLPPIEGGDELYIPFNLQAISGAPTATATGTPVGASLRVRPTEKRMTKSRFALNAKKRRTITAELAKKTADEISKIMEEIDSIKAKATENRKDIMQLSDADYETIYKGFALRVDPYEKKQKTAIQDFNAHQRKEVIANLPKITKSFFSASVKAISKADLFDFEAGVSALVDLTQPVFYDLAGKEGKEAAALLGISGMDILSPEVRKALDKAIELLSHSYNETTQQLLKDKLEEGLKLGLSQDELADTINGVYDYSDEVRAATVARTETFRIANYATQEAWKQSGVVKAQRWYTAADERVCPYCYPMHGKTISIDEDYFKKGDTVTGDDGSQMKVDYSNVSAPPLHPSCRCYIRPEEITLD